MFNCIEVDSVRYLRSDLSIECESEPHQSAQAFAGFMIAAFPVGLPLLYFMMLHLNRKQLFDDDGKMAFLQFFYREYKEELYYWEAVECLRKCLLMGFASFFQPGTLMQLVLVIILTTLYMLLLTHCKPWESLVDDGLAILDQSMLFLVLVGALMLKVEQGFDSNGVFGEGYSSGFVTAMLITSTAVVTLAGVAVLLAVILNELLGSMRARADAEQTEEQVEKQEQQQDLHPENPTKEQAMDDMPHAMQTSMQSMQSMQSEQTSAQEYGQEDGAGGERLIKFESFTLDPGSKMRLTAGAAETISGEPISPTEGGRVKALGETTNITIPPRKHSDSSSSSGSPLYNREAETISANKVSILHQIDDELQIATATSKIIV